MKKQFIQFLKDNRLYSAFKKSIALSFLRLSIDDYFDDTKSNLYIICAFSWGHTKQGFEVWWGLDKKWQSILK